MLKPGLAKRRRLGRLRRFWERLLNGGASPQDALYLTNRTWAQKLRLWLLVSVPLLVLFALLGYAMLTPRRVPDGNSTPGDPAAKTPPLPDQLSLPQSSELQVTEAVVEKSGASSHIAGTLSNRSGRSFTGAEVIFDLTDGEGSQVGTATARVGPVTAHGTISFRVAVSQDRASYALVREVRSSS